MSATRSGVAPRVPLSNRRGTRALSAAPGPRPEVPVGLDRLSLSFPVSGFETSETAWDTVTRKAAGRHGSTATYGKVIRLEDGRQVHVGAQLREDAGEDREGILTGRIDLNPSKVADPTDWRLRGIEAVAPAVEFGREMALRLVEPVTEPQEWNVTRSDTARDFTQVANPSRLLRGLAPVHRAWARRNLVHADPTKHGAQTLMVGSGAGVVRAYDKHAETQGKAPEGSLRWEAECRRGWLEQYGGVKVLGDLNAEAVQRLAWNRWDWSAMGVKVSATNRVVEKVWRSEGYTDREKALFLGYLLSQASDWAWLPGSTHTLAKFRKMQREIGVTLSPGDLDGEGEGLVSHLDFETGREVIGAAA